MNSQRQRRLRRAAAIAVVAVGVVVLVARMQREEDGALPARPDRALEHAPAGVREQTTPGASAGTATVAMPLTPQPPSGPASSPAPGPGLQVQVTAGGQAVAEAAVHVYRRAPRQGGADEWAPAGSGICRRDGILLVTAAPGAYLVTASAPGWAPGYAETLRAAGEALTRVEVRLERGVRVTGRTVERRTRRDVPLVSLSFVPARTVRRGLPGFPGEERVVTSSDARGAFTVAGLTPGRWRLEARGAGYAPRSLDVVAPPPEEVVVELTAAAIIEGLVTRDGQPVPHATVTVTGSKEPVVLESGPMGAFAAEVDPGAHRVFAQVGDEMGGTDRPIVVAAGAIVRGVEVRLGPPARITGRVRSGSGPVEEATVVASSGGESGPVASARSGKDGRYELRPLPPATYTVSASAARGAVRVPGVTLRAGDRFPLDLVLGDATAVEGTVTDSSGAPVSGALVSATGGWFAGGAAGARAAARTDASGHYRLEGLAGGPLRISARRDETSPPSTRGLMLEEGAIGKVDLVLVDGGVVAGTVVDARANPVPGAVVARADASRRGWRGGPGQVTADDAGSYLLSLPPGTYGLSAWRPERVLRFGARPVVLATVTVAAGSRSQVDLVLPDDPVGNLAGRVLEPGGAPSALAAVRVTTSSAGTLLLGSDGEGAFTATVPDGEQVVVSARNGGRTGSLTVTPPVSDLVVQLQPAASLEGRLVGEPPPETFSLYASTTGAMRPGSGSWQLQFAGATFALADLAPGQITLHVQADDGRVGDAQASVGVGESHRVDIVLSPAAVVTGRLVDGSTGQPVARARISVDGMPRRFAIGPDGRFSKTLATGQHTILIAAPGYGFLSRSVVARPDGPNDLGDLPLVPQPSARSPGVP